MARDLLEGDPDTADFLHQAEARLAMPLGRLMVDGPEAELQATSNAQPAILFHSLALLRLMSARGLGPDLVAGRPGQLDDPDRVASFAARIPGSRFHDR